MSNIETVTLDGAELKVEGLGGQNTIIINRGSANLYASAYADAVPDGDNVALILPGGAMNLHGTNGTVYLLGTGKVQLQGTDTADLPIALGGASGGGGGGGSAGVSQEYVDNADTATLRSAKKYTDDEIASVREDIPVIPEALPADGGSAETAEKLALALNYGNSGVLNKWAKVGVGILQKRSYAQVFDTSFIYSHRNTTFNLGYYNEAFFRIHGTWSTDGIVNAIFSVVDLPSSLSADNFKVVINDAEDETLTVELYIRMTLPWSYAGFYLISNNFSWKFSAPVPEEHLDELPEGTVINCQYASTHTEAELADLKAYIGYTDSDIYGLEADFENNRFTRLAGAVGKTAGADFDNIRAFGGRKRCNLADDGTVLAYYGENNYEEDGYVGVYERAIQTMVEQPKFYYKVVPLKTEKIAGADGYHLRKARYYISDTPKSGFKVHPAFIQNGNEVDKIYLSAYEGCLRDVSAMHHIMNDEQVADFDNDMLASIANAKPASGTTQALTRANARKLAQNRGAGWGITNIQTFSMSQLLFIIEYGGFNSQSLLGVGGSGADARTGATSELGNTSGNKGGTISYRGEEDLWGGKWMFCDNVYAITIENGLHTSFNISGEKSSLYAPVLTQANYISSFSYDPLYDWAFIASEALGSSALPVGDHFQNNTSGEAQWIISGHGSGNDSGLFAQGVFAATAHWESLGARLIYIPQTTAQEVTAND